MWSTGSWRWRRSRGSRPSRSESAARRAALAPHRLQTSSRIPMRRSARAIRPSPQEEITMPTYIMLSTLTPEGIQTVKNNPQRIHEVNKEVEQLGATVKAQWATLGHVDFISVVEAPDEATMARVSLELGSRGTGRYETLSAIPVEEFIASLSPEGPCCRVGGGGA